MGQGAEPLDYETPGTRRPREYRGCLLPMGIGIAVLGLALRLIEHPVGPAEENTAMLRLGGFLAVAAVVIILGLGRRRRK